MKDTELQEQYAKRKRIISYKECKVDLEEVLPQIFTAYHDALNNYNKEIVLTPPEARCRGLEASLLNSKMIQSIQNIFKDNWFFGKYKRFIVRINGYIILFKKKKKKGMPMNIPTKFNSSIQNQVQGCLFDAYDNGIDPIVFFGYKKDKFGEICDPQLVYIDENKVKWTIIERDFKTNNIVSINPQSDGVKLSIRKNGKKDDGTND